MWLQSHLPSSGAQTVRRGAAAAQTRVKPRHSRGGFGNSAPSQAVCALGGRWGCRWGWGSLALSLPGQEEGAARSCCSLLGEHSLPGTAPGWVTTASKSFYRLLISPAPLSWHRERFFSSLELPVFAHGRGRVKPPSPGGNDPEQLESFHSSQKAGLSCYIFICAFSPGEAFNVFVHPPAEEMLVRLLEIGKPHQEIWGCLRG